jgi:hypothetical protein
MSSQCQYLTHTGQQCQRQSENSNNICWQHSKSKIKNQKGGAKQKLPVPSCSIQFVPQNRAEVLYGNSRILNFMKECHVDPTQISLFKKDIVQLTTYKKAILDLARYEILNRPDYYGQLLSIHMHHLKQDVLAPQLNEIQIGSYQVFINDRFIKLKELNEKQDYVAMSQILLEIVKESQKYEDATGICYFLLRLFAKDSNYSTNTHRLLEWWNDITTDFIYALTDKSIGLSRFESATEPNSDLSLLTLKKGTIAYKAVPKDDLHRLTDYENYFWLAYDLMNSINYLVESRAPKTLGQMCTDMGKMGIYKVNQDIQLLNLSQVSHVKNVIAYAIKHNNPKIAETISKAFPIKTNPDGSETLSRKSEGNPDKEITKWLCQNGYAGYTSDQIGGFASEIMLCSPRGSVELIGHYDINDLKFYYCKPPYNHLNTSLEKL